MQHMSTNSSGKQTCTDGGQYTCTLVYQFCLKQCSLTTGQAISQSIIYYRDSCLKHLWHYSSTTLTSNTNISGQRKNKYLSNWIWIIVYDFAYVMILVKVTKGSILPASRKLSLFNNTKNILIQVLRAELVV